MNSLTLQQEDLNKISYNDLMISNKSLTDKQRLVIKLKEKEQAKKRFEKAIKDTIERVKAEPKKIWMNYDRKYYLVEDITPEQVEREIEL
jgi:hypothetical protein